MKKKPVVVTLLLLFFCAFFLNSGPAPVNAEVGAEVDHTDNRLRDNSDSKDDVDGEVIVNDVTTDPDTLYERYKDNSFDLMTKEQEGTSGFKKHLSNFSGTIKAFFWEGTKGLGTFNTEMVKFLFNLDIVTAIRAPFQTLAASIAQNMLSIAGTIGICFVAVIMVIKYMGEQRIKAALGLFGMTILIFVGLSIISDANSTNSLFNTIFTADKAVESAFVNVTPVLGDSSVPKEDKDSDSNKRMKSAGDMIASRVFYTNVYEPYLLTNYGTTNLDSIRKSKVKYDDQEYDRINLLLDNDITSKKGQDIHDKTIEYEADDLKNKTIQHFNNLKNTFFLGFYFVVNLVQSAAYFILCFIRIIIGALQVFLIPILPFLLFMGLFLITTNVLANFAKVLGMTVFLKAMAGFACILFATFLSYGFQLSSKIDNPWQKILTIVIYLLTPFGLYFFRSMLGTLISGQMNMKDAVGFLTHPFSTEKLKRDDYKAKRKERRQQQKDAKEKRKRELENKRKKAKERGKQDLGLNQPKEKKANNRSRLRKELNQQAKPKHKPDNKRQELQKKLQSMHEKSREDDKEAIKQSARQRKRKELDKAALRTGEAVRNANQELNEKQDSTLKNAKRRAGTSTKRRSAATEKDSRTNLNNLVTKSGRSTKRKRGGSLDSQVPATTRRQQGKKVVPSDSDGGNTTPKQGKTINPRSSSRTTRKVSGQRQSISGFTTTRSSAARRGGVAGMSSARRSPAVRRKMTAVQSVINATEETVTTVVETQETTQHKLSRMAKREVPVRKKSTNRPKTIPVRRTKPVKKVKTINKKK